MRSHEKDNAPLHTLSEGDSVTLKLTGEKGIVCCSTVAGVYQLLMVGGHKIMVKTTHVERGNNV